MDRENDITNESRWNEFLIPISILIAGAIFSGTLFITNSAKANESNSPIKTTNAAAGGGQRVQQSGGGGCGV